MIIKYTLPDCFVPNEMSFQIYCAIKLLRGNYITKEEAMKICGFQGQEQKQLMDTYNNFEEAYKKICGRPYTDWEYEEDPKERD